MPTLAEAVAVLDAAYDPRLAQPWDAVGLVCGDPGAEIRRVLFAVDPVGAVIDEALDWGADLLVTHHPLLLKPVHGVPATNPKGHAVHRLISHGVALLTAHTNADTANPGVSDALARALGLTVRAPLLPDPHDPARGLGRLGELPAAEPLARFVERVAAALPATRAGIRATGEPGRPVRVVAVCGGAGDDRDLLAAVRACGADAYVTADLRHHPASEAVETGEYAAPGSSPALVDVAHWASEWPWLADAAAALTAGLGAPAGPRGTVETRVSHLVTDPWTLHTPPRHLA